MLTCLLTLAPIHAWVAKINGASQRDSIFPPGTNVPQGFNLRRGTLRSDAAPHFQNANATYHASFPGDECPKRPYG